MDEKDLYWMIGILEGEGCFHARSNHDCRYPVQIVLRMTDKDIVQKVANYWERGIRGYNRDKRYRTVYVTTISGTEALKWMQKLYPLMGMRRKEQIQKCFRISNVTLNDRIYRSNKALSPTQEKRLKELYQNKNITQRDLAKKFKVSVGVVNKIINHNYLT